MFVFPALCLFIKSVRPLLSLGPVIASQWQNCPAVVLEESSDKEPEWSQVTVDVSIILLTSKFAYHTTVLIFYPGLVIVRGEDKTY